MKKEEWRRIRRNWNCEWHERRRPNNTRYIGRNLHRPRNLFIYFPSLSSSFLLNRDEWTEKEGGKYQENEKKRYIYKALCGKRKKKKMIKKKSRSAAWQGWLGGIGPAQVDTIWTVIMIRFYHGHLTISTSRNYKLPLCWVSNWYFRCYFNDMATPWWAIK